MSDYKEEDFSKMMFPVWGEIDVLETYPQLKGYPEFCAKVPEINRVLKYIFFTYDKDSPLQKIDNLSQKKKIAMKLAKIPDELCEEILKGNKEVNLMIIRYCRMQSSRTYSLLCIGNEAFFSSLAEILNYKSISDDVLTDTKLKQQIFEKAKQNAEYLDEMGKQFLQGDSTPLVQKVLSNVMDEEYIKLSPEDFSNG